MKKLITFCRWVWCVRGFRIHIIEWRKLDFSIHFPIFQLVRNQFGVNINTIIRFELLRHFCWTQSHEHISLNFLNVRIQKCSRVEFRSYLGSWNTSSLCRALERSIRRRRSIVLFLLRKFRHEERLNALSRGVKLY